jgi:hypothetical protein
MEAIDLLATTEGILVDPVYSAKAVAALIDLAAKKELVGRRFLAHRWISFPFSTPITLEKSGPALSDFQPCRCNS